MKQTLIIFLFLSSLVVFGQPRKWDKSKSVTKKMLKQESHPDDKDAGAAVLFDMGQSRFIESGNSYDIIYERVTRIKIYDESGLNYAQVEVPYYIFGSQDEEIESIKAVTYNLDNDQISVKELEKENIFDAEINKYYHAKRFAMPDVKPGSIIEYRVRKKIENKFRLPSWNFQWKIPVSFSQYQVKMVPFYSYAWNLQNVDNLDIYKKFESRNRREYRVNIPYGSNYYSDVVYRYGMKDVPAFESEALLTSVNDYLMRIEFQLHKYFTYRGTEIEVVTTWENLLDELLGRNDFGKFLKKSQRKGDKVFDFKNLKGLNNETKIKHIIEFTKQYFRWNGYYGKLTDRTVKEFIKAKTGNTAEINLFTAGLLKEAGFDVHPVMISTRDHGKISTKYPFIHMFNYVLIAVKAKGEYRLYDATHPHLPYYLIPSECISNRGLVIQNNDLEWLSLRNHSTTMIQNQYNIVIDSNGHVKSDITYDLTEYEAEKSRKKYADNPLDISEWLKEKHQGASVSNIQTENFKDLHKPYRIKFHLETEATKTGDKIFFNPFMEEVISETPLKEDSRNFPVDFTYPQMFRYISTIKIPSGYEADHLPLMKKIDEKRYKLIYQVLLQEDEINLICDYVFKKPVYPAKDFRHLKNFYKVVVKKGNEKIVLKKKE